MYKATQDARHLQRREGSFATVPSARGVNLLGWEEPENLSPLEQRKAIGRRVGQIQTFLAAHKDLRGQDKWKLVKELTKLVQRMRELKPAARAELPKKDVPQHFMAVARERLTKPEFDIWLKEARERARASGVTPSSALTDQERDLLRCGACVFRVDPYKHNHQSQQIAALMERIAGVPEVQPQQEKNDGRA